MTGSYDIALDKGAGMLRLTMGGFFDAALVDEMRAALVVALRQLNCPPGEHVTLCDITGMNIQSQELVQRFAALVGSPEVVSRRLAFVTGATLARLQARRLTSRDGVAYFSDVPSAMAWLIDERAAA
jgi:hypothetical protein